MASGFYSIGKRTALTQSSWDEGGFNKRHNFNSPSDDHSRESRIDPRESRSDPRESRSDPLESRSDPFDLDTATLFLNVTTLQHSCKKLNKLKTKLEKKRKKKEKKKSHQEDSKDFKKKKQAYTDLYNEIQDERAAVEKIFDKSGRSTDDNQTSRHTTSERQKRKSRPHLPQMDTEGCVNCHLKETKIWKLEADIDKYKKDILRLSADIDYEKRDKQDNNRSRGVARDLQHKIAELETQIAIERSEKEDALRRLSSMASAKLRDNNPNIADLSDPKRPTKIAEMLSEIYDNEWTDAYDHLEKYYSKKEEDNVQLLLNVLIEVHQQFNNQSEDILSNITAPLKPTDIPPEVRKNLKDAVKMLAEFKIPAVVKDIKSNLPSRLSNAVHLFQHPGDVFDVYIDKCIEACLLMSVQDPPMYLSAVPNKDGLFSHSLYRAYTKIGKYEVFIVWPVLYLHKNGPMMAKGVAQGTDGNTMVKNNSNQSYQQPAPYHYVARRQHNYEHRQQHHQEQDWNQYGGMQTSYESPANNRLPTKNPSHYRGQGSSNKPFSKTYHPGTSTSQNTVI